MGRARVAAQDGCQQTAEVVLRAGGGEERSNQTEDMQPLILRTGSRRDHSFRESLHCHRVREPFALRVLPETELLENLTSPFGF